LYPYLVFESVINYLYCVFISVSRGTASEIQVLVGNINLTPESPSQLLGVEVIRAHEDYNTGSRINDLAILKVGF
jgi:secreted trypsin-like serine protease